MGLIKNIVIIIAIPLTILILVGLGYLTDSIFNTGTCLSIDGTSNKTINLSEIQLTLSKIALGSIWFIIVILFIVQILWIQRKDFL